MSSSLTIRGADELTRSYFYFVMRYTPAFPFAVHENNLSAGEWLTAAFRF